MNYRSGLTIKIRRINSKSIIMKNKFAIFLSFLAFTFQTISAQTAEQDTTMERMKIRTSFAKMYIGMDVQNQLGGNTQYINPIGNVTNTDFGGSFTPRFVIGGTHFWGHADFYVAFNLTKPQAQALPNNDFTQLNLSRGVELGLHYYPWAIKEGAIRPYIGLGVESFTYYHGSKAKEMDYATIPQISKNIVPFHAGVTYASAKFLFKLGMEYQTQTDFKYPITRTIDGDLKLNPLSVNASIKFWFNSNGGLATKSGLRSVKSGLNTLSKQHKLNAFYLGIGPSGSFQMTPSDYVTEKYPFLSQESRGSNITDIVAGYYLHKPDMNIGLSYRNMKSSVSGFDVNEQFQRKSYMLEIYKFLGDYHGFVPFVGPTLAYEDLSLVDTDKGKSQAFSEKKLAIGIILGWDIRLTRSEWWILRTNLRYTPNLHLKADGKKAMFDDLEFNFIQFTFFPERLLAFNKK
jgi:hypothetical protein